MTQRDLARPAVFVTAAAGGGSRRNRPPARRAGQLSTRSIEVAESLRGVLIVGCDDVLVDLLRPRCGSAVVVA